MLEIYVPDSETFDESTSEFHSIKGQTLQLEHSLLSISKWESKWHKPFIDNNDKTTEEILDYIKCMTLNKNVDPNLYYVLTEENVKAVNDYINDPMTATTINEVGKKRGSGNGERVTSELIYYWMIALNIPVEFQKWHLNRLMMLIRVCSIKNEPGKKMSKSEILRSNKALNASRRQRLGTKG